VLFRKKTLFLTRKVSLPIIEIQFGNCLLSKCGDFLVNVLKSEIMLNWNVGSPDSKTRQNISTILPMKLEEFSITQSFLTVPCACANT